MSTWIKSEVSSQKLKLTRWPRFTSLPLIYPSELHSPCLAFCMICCTTRASTLAVCSAVDSVIRLCCGDLSLPAWTCQSECSFAFKNRVGKSSFDISFITPTWLTAPLLKHTLTVKHTLAVSTQPLKAGHMDSYKADRDTIQCLMKYSNTSHKIYTELIASLVFYSEQHNDARNDRTRRVRTVIKNIKAKKNQILF